MHANAPLSMCPTLFFPHCVHMSLLYICISIPSLNIGSPAPLFWIPYIWASLIAQLVKNPPAMQETPSSISGSRRSAGEGIGYPLQYSGLEISMDCIVYGVTKSWTQLSDFHFHFIYVNIQYLFFSFWLHSEFIHLIITDSNLFLSMAE